MSTVNGSALATKSLEQALTPPEPPPPAPPAPEAPPTALQPGTDLELRVQAARTRVALQSDPALTGALTDEELERDRLLAEWGRDQERTYLRASVQRGLGGRRRQAELEQRLGTQRTRHEEWSAKRELAREVRALKLAEKLEDEEASDSRWHRRAVVARRRVTSPDAKLAKLYKRMTWSGRALIAVVLLGMVWSAINVQSGLVPDGDRSNPLYWLSFGIESMLSVPLVVIMLHATTAAMWGREVRRGQVALMEAGLLAVNIGLNAGPHIARAHYQQAAESLVAPVMVAVIIWLHAWTSAQYADLIANVFVPGDDDGGRLGADTARLLDAVALVQSGLRMGVVQPSEDGGSAPSASRIAKVYGLSKGDACTVRDAINRLVTTER